MKTACRTLWICLGLMAVAATLAGRAAGAVTTLVSCAAGSGAGEDITHGFYVANFPGVSLQDVTLRFSANASGLYVLTLTARLGGFGGPVLGSATQGVVLNGSFSSLVSVTFSFSSVAPVPVPKGATVAFVIGRQGTGPETLLFDTSPSGPCSVVETNDTTPPLSTVRGNVTATITGDAAPPTSNNFTNGTFNTNISGWSQAGGGTGTAVFDAQDANGYSGSGSALLTNSDAGASTTHHLDQCVTPTHAGSYTFGGKVRYPSGQSAQSGPFISVSGFSDLNCTGTPLGFEQSPVPTKYDTWQNLSKTLTLPVDTSWKSMRVEARLFKAEAGGTVRASFDDLFFRSAHLGTLTTLANASIHGKAGSFFHTDLWVLNRSYRETITVNATFRCYAGFDCGTPNKSFSLAPREQRLFTDVLSSLFNASETAGAIELTLDSFLAEMSASSRTYTPDLPNPTNGTGIPAQSSTATRGRAVFTGLAANGGDLSSGFRSNAGAYNPSASSTTVTLTLYDGSGALIGSVPRTFAGLEAYQFNDVFAAVGAGGMVVRNATMVVTSDVPIFSFVTVVDNQTNDTTLVLPTDDENGP